LLRRMVAGVGMGWLDRLLGGVFGLLRGVVVVVLGFLIVAVVMPNAPWIRQSRFGPSFLAAAQQTLRNAHLATPYAGWRSGTMQ
jgi:membrane protein required for colicin V production